MKALVLLCALVSTTHQFCFPDQDIRECLIEKNEAQAIKEAASTTRESSETVIEEEDVGITLKSSQAIPYTRNSLISGRYCFSTRGYSGKCRYPRRCKGRSYSFSRTCGWKHVCCKEYNKLKLPTEQPRHYRVTTKRPTRRTTRRTTVTKVDETCGVAVTDLIFCRGDKNCTAGEGQFPFMVSFVYTSLRSPENFCGGALISSRHVLSAAHCFYNIEDRDWQSGRVDVRIGQNDITQSEKKGTRANIARIAIHPGYREKSGQVVSPVNDIAVVSLDREVSRPGLITICLPDPAYPVSLTRKLTVAGWGANSTSTRAQSITKLQFAELETTTTRDCQVKYSEVLRGTSAKVEIREESMLCAGGREEDTCRGDSGSPMFGLDTRYRMTVVGLVSFGPSRCGSGLPGVFTRVDNFTDWIRRVLEL